MARRVLRGRGEELAAAVALLRRASRTGVGSVLTVRGEPGIGKTAMLRAVAEQAARAGFAVGSGKAEELHQIAVGGPLLVALRSGTRPLLDADTFSSLAPLHQQPVWLVDRIASALEERAQRTPLMIAIDDVQWADPVTRFALEVLPGRLAGLPIVWVFATRDTGWTDPHDLGEDVERHQLELGPLSAVDLDGLALDVLGGPAEGPTRGRLHSVGGNPFLAIQLLQGVSAARSSGADPDEIPATFTAAVDARLRSLSPGAAELIELAAVWGQPLGLSEAADILAGPSGATITAWRLEGREQGLLADGRDHIGFPHDLIRQAVYHSMPAALRRLLHRRCANYLVASGKGAVAAAPHARAGAVFGDGEAVDILRAAAAETSHALPEIAAPMIAEAFDLVDPHDPRWSEIGEQCAEILTRAQRGSEAVAVVDALLARVTDADTRARLESIAAQSLWLMGQLEDIERRVSQAQARSAVSPPLRVRLSAVEALVLSRVGTAQKASAAAESTLARGRALGDIPTQVIALQTLGETESYEGRYASARSRYRALRALGGATYLAGEISALQHLDRFDEAEGLLTRAHEPAGHRPDTVLPSLVFAQLWQHFKLGRFDDAEEAARTLLRLCDELGTYVHKLDAWLLGSVIAVIRGDLPLARERLRPAEATGWADDAVRTPGVLLIKGRIAAAEGDYQASVRILKPLMASLAHSRSWWPRSHELLRIHAGAAVASGDHEFARQTVEHARVSVERNPGVASFEGVALQVEGFVSGDVALLRDAVKILRESPRPMLLAGALADYGGALVNLGEQAAAAKALVEARDIYVGLGAELFLTGVQRDLRRAGATADGSADHPSATLARRSLTGAEERVAVLVSEGHTNQSAASALGVSIHTVNTHLRAVFRKMNVQSRVQLANAMRASDTRPG